MPYEWSVSPEPEAAVQLRIWPHRSLTRTGFVGFVAVTAALAALPVLTLIGTPSAWVVLGFAIAAVSALWTALRASDRDREILEVLSLTSRQAELVRCGPLGQRQVWQADPYWVEVALYPTQGPVPHYLTLRGGGREVELGALLTEAERVALAAEIRAALRAARDAGGTAAEDGHAPARGIPPEPRR